MYSSQWTGLVRHIKSLCSMFASEQNSCITGLTVRGDCTATWQLHTIGLALVVFSIIHPSIITCM